MTLYKNMNGGGWRSRILRAQITYITHTAYDGDKARLMITASTRPLSLDKTRMCLLTRTTKYVTGWSESGSIVCKYENGKTIAVKINSKYWMYWGYKYFLPLL
jgi:hypothetical protein